MQAPELTLIVAATRSMGIGAHGSMPWAGSLRKEMQYFARVTSRPPPQVRLPSPACPLARLAPLCAPAGLGRRR